MFHVERLATLKEPGVSIQQAKCNPELFHVKRSTMRASTFIAPIEWTDVPRGTIALNVHLLGLAGSGSG